MYYSHLHRAHLLHLSLPATAPQYPRDLDSGPGGALSSYTANHTGRIPSLGHPSRLRLQRPDGDQLLGKPRHLLHHRGQHEETTERHTLLKIFYNFIVFCNVLFCSPVILNGVIVSVVTIKLLNTTQEMTDKVKSGQNWTYALIDLCLLAVYFKIAFFWKRRREP